MIDVGFSILYLASVFKYKLFNNITSKHRSVKTYLQPLKIIRIVISLSESLKVSFQVNSRTFPNTGSVAGASEVHCQIPATSS